MQVKLKFKPILNRLTQFVANVIRRDIDAGSYSGGNLLQMTCFTYKLNYFKITMCYHKIYLKKNNYIFDIVFNTLSPFKNHFN